jgi:hypothetical protein
MTAVRLRTCWRVTRLPFGVLFSLLDAVCVSSIGIRWWSAHQAVLFGVSGNDISHLQPYDLKIVIHEQSVLVDSSFLISCLPSAAT